MNSSNPSGVGSRSTPAGLAPAEHKSAQAAQPGSAENHTENFNHESDVSSPGSIEPAAIDPADVEPATARDPKETVPHRRKTSFRGSWTLITIVSALLLTLLSVAGIILVTRPRATIDQLLILTFPSGADVTFDGRKLGPSPVKLEGVRMGTHRIQLTKEGYQDAEYDESIPESRTLDYKLKLMPPPGAEGLTQEQQISQYKQNMEDAFARGEYATPYYGKSALYFAHLILERDTSNPSAMEMKDRVLKALVQSAQAAMSKVDLAQAQEIVSTLSSYFQDDEEARAAAAKLEAQLAIHRSDVRELVRKAEDALRAGNLIDPPRASAYYYSKQALTLDRQNQRAKAVKTQVRDQVLKSIDQTAVSGNLAQATRELEQALKLFPEDPQLQAKQKDLEQQQAAEAKANDPRERRLRGLENYNDGKYAEAIPDLEYAVHNERAGQEVISALGMSYKKLRDFDRAVTYLSQVRPSSEDSYRSAVAALGDIYAERGNFVAATENYKKARDLGGSALYTPVDLEDKIERLEKKQAAKLVIEPTPLTIQVKHIHGGILHSSCSGTLTVDGSGVRYDGSDHVFAANLVHAGVRVSKDEMAVQFQDKNEKFRPVHPQDGERFREALSRYQSAQASAR